MIRLMNPQSGYFGDYGGQFTSDTTLGDLAEVEEAFFHNRKDKTFLQQVDVLRREYSCRPTPLYFAKNLTDELGGAKIYLKREDLNYTGSYNLNNTIGQVVLAKRMGKKVIITETGSGQHGVATAAVSANLGLSCMIFMGEDDMKRHQLNVQKMNLLGAEVIPVSSGSKTLMDAINEIWRYRFASPTDTYHLYGTVIGPHPYPMIVREFQKIIGKETREQILDKEGHLPDSIIACIGGGSNALGIFDPFLEEENIRLIGVEAGGKGVDTNQHAATLTKGTVGVFHGARSYVVKDPYGHTQPVHSISTGLTYPGVGPELAFLKDNGNIECHYQDNQEALGAFHLLSRTEGILSALESAHAVAFCVREAPKLPRNHLMIVNLSGHGDKDLDVVLDYTRNHKKEPIRIF
ncbi:tryptophan synthase subunit beta [Alkalihalobacillus sp. TS-13]|uniref:tryptophan synthase subunit beta n=1 Tax=Alkalihalobacillus sp. TS-13 TaxID=2842455 RepID=UPI001C86E035|nr:tryptophan synthase subunit beta [Alkalihalobacillus sp. TS-13]